MKPTPLALCACSAAACGNGQETVGSEAEAESEAEAVCAADCDAYAACGEEAADERDACVSLCVCLSASWTPEAFDVWEACLAEDPCGEPGGNPFEEWYYFRCTGQATSAVADLAGENYLALCAARRGECPDGFDADACDADFLGLQRPAAIGELATCMDLACDDIPDCIGEALFGCFPRGEEEGEAGIGGEDVP